MKRILIAGIGNIFFGDDAFGCEVISELSHRDLPAEVCINDFGIRSYDLACALTKEYEAVILVDAAPRGQPPGTVYLIEPDRDQLQQLAPATPDGHSLDPASALQLARSFGGCTGRLFLVGCEPAVLQTDDGAMGLSAPVREAIPRAIDLIESLLENFVLTTNDNLVSA
ncbi:MAG TPA: hydrogenase maturation protease [Verrucomicrobiae bacterium]|nr:hydrogenase maturation protease [Verrucomicrobiae bacterium]